MNVVALRPDSPAPPPPPQQEFRFRWTSTQEGKARAVSIEAAGRAIKEHLKKIPGATLLEVEKV